MYVDICVCHSEGWHGDCTLTVWAEAEDVAKLASAQYKHDQQDAAENPDDRLSWVVFRSISLY